MALLCSGYRGGPAVPQTSRRRPPSVASSHSTARPPGRSALGASASGASDTRNSAFCSEMGASSALRPSGKNGRSSSPRNPTRSTSCSSVSSGSTTWTVSIVARRARCQETCSVSTRSFQIERRHAVDKRRSTVEKQLPRVGLVGSVVVLGYDRLWGVRQADRVAPSADTAGGCSESCCRARCEQCSSIHPGLAHFAGSETPGCRFHRCDGTERRQAATATATTTARNTA